MDKRFVRRRQIAIALFISLLILGIGALSYVVYQKNFVASKDYEGTGNGNVVVVKVDQGASMSSLASELLSEGVIASRYSFIKAAEDNPDSNYNLHPGYYTLEQEMSGDSAVKALLDDANRRGVVDIANGQTLEDVQVVGGGSRPGIFTLISQQSCTGSGENSGCVTLEQLEHASATTAPAALGVPEWAQKEVAARGEDPKRLEGLIAPGVLLFNPTASPQEILKELLEQSQQIYEGTGLIAAAEKQKMTPYMMLTAASLVEREAPPNDFDKVARVIFNRLDIGQRLEFDSTVNYALDEQEVATTSADRAQENPWNTYVKDGLPDTPIASPSLAALHAVEHPADGDWLYFVTIDQDGKTVFNSTFEAHQEDSRRSGENGVLDSNR